MRKAVASTGGSSRGHNGECASAISVRLFRILQDDTNLSLCGILPCSNIFDLSSSLHRLSLVLIFLFYTGRIVTWPRLSQL